jgi:hypothetical protein
MNLNPFQNKSPDKQLAAVRADCVKRDAEIVEAKRQVLAKAKYRDELADDGKTGDELRNAVAVHNEAKEYLETLERALEKKRELVDILQAEVFKIEDKQLRAKTAPAVDQLADDIVAACADSGTELKRLSELTGRASLIVLDAKGIEVFASSAINELQAACDLVASILHSYAKAVLPGGAPAAMPQPAPVLAPLPQPAPMANVLSSQPVKWHDASGVFHIEPKWRELCLPVAVATRAVVRPGHELWKQKGWETKMPKLSDCIDLDDPDAPVRPDNVQSLQPKEVHSAFEKPTIGPAYPMRVSRNEGLPATASRNLNEDKP